MISLLAPPQSGRHASVAQLAEASDSKSECCGFESHRRYQQSPTRPRPRTDRVRWRTPLSTTWVSLYEAAKAVQHPRNVSSYIEAGGVAAAVESSSRRIYTGVCVDTACTLGICAERNAILNMITNGEDTIRRVLTIMRDGCTGPPCGACREMMTQLMPSRFGAIEVMIDYVAGKTMTLADLTPQWWLRR